MRLVRLTLPLVCLGAASAPLHAQRAGPVGDPAQFLLAHTGDLKLSDAQVVRLAAIARRSEERQRSMRSMIDSLPRACGPGGRCDSTARAQRMRKFERLQPRMERMREQGRTDLRDAIAVLTADQQASAWELVARPRGPMGGFAFGRGGMPGGRGGGGGGMRGRDGGPGQRFGPPRRPGADSGGPRRPGQ
jgi:LTXXQ motif family protein